MIKIDNGLMPLGDILSQTIPRPARSAVRRTNKVHGRAIPSRLLRGTPVYSNPGWQRPR